MAEPVTDTTTAPEAPRAVLSRVETLRNRPDFLRVARGRRVVTEAFILQAAPRPQSAPPDGTLRVGFTCSKKVGNAVARNRAKRRLREIARLVLPGHGAPDTDYVLIGRAGRTATRDFAALQDDLRRSLETLHGKPPAPERPA
jgi:ribonuclease P protein component